MLTVGWHQAEATERRPAAISSDNSHIFSGLALIAITLALNLILAAFNTWSALQVERKRAQSTLLLEAIKTNGDEDTACKNLLFFVS